ncbi:MAG: type II secretion system F family protein [Planctomycetota bacterium]|jgi:general secretion pathway protein F
MTDAPARSDRVSLEQLIAFNDEIASLIRSGVPLELGLKQLGHSTAGGLARLSQRLSERMETGVTLQQALDDEGDRIPGVYRAVVEAGLRSGRLPQALEEMSGLAGALLDLHRRIAIALLYPAIVFLMAWGLLTFVSFEMIPRFLVTHKALGLTVSWLTRVLSWLGDNAAIWCPGVPLVAIIVGLFLAQRVSSEHNTSAGRLVSSRLHRFAWFPSIIENYDRATFTRTLHLLVQNHLPLHEAVLLAGWATGCRRIIRDTTSVAQRLQAGDSLQTSLESARNLPSFLRWMLASGERNGNLAAVLTTAGNVYQERANQQAEMLKSVLPAVLTVLIGGSVTLVYGLLLFGPVFEMFHDMAAPLF